PACVQSCASDASCRAIDGYKCEPAAKLCLPGPPPGNGNANIGEADCAAAWGGDGSKLSRCDTVRDEYVVVRKSARNLALCSKGKHLVSYRAGLGFAPSGDKEKEGDGKTPEGVFYIPRVLPNSSYYKAFLLSYPDEADAARGLSAGLITASQKSAIEAAQRECREPPQNTGLGGLIEIHGHGGSSDWTLGCVAIDNRQVDYLWSILGVGDTIVVLP
ncbi:MAG: murein L,D-transpeptidase family protein, partial [Myxococcales bacterium]